MTDLYGNFEIPSNREKLLKELIDLKITDIYKCAFYSYKEYQDYLSEIGNAKTDMVDYFKFVDGQYLFKFSNGWEIAFVYNEETYSLTLSMQKDDASTISSYIFEDMDVKDILSVKEIYKNEYTNLILNKSIKGIKILSLANISGKKIGLPNENGIKFIFDSTSELILSLGLIKNNATFSLLDKDDTNLNDFLVKMDCK